MLRVEQLTKSFGSFEAVSSLDFSVEAGQVLGLIGPNGAGKTTTLRCIAGILNFNSGKIQIAGHDIRKKPVEAKRSLAYLPDSPGFFETLTLWEHLAFTAQLYQVKDFKKRGEWLLDIFGLTEKKSHFTGQLSRGQRQAMGLICAFLHEPKLMILDEPMTALDPARIQTLNELIRGAAAKGSALIVSSHLLTILEQTYTKVLVMNQGKSLFYANAKEVEEKLRKEGGVPLEQLFFKVTHETEHTR